MTVCHHYSALGRSTLRFESLGVTDRCIQYIKTRCAVHTFCTTLHPLPPTSSDRFPRSACSPRLALHPSAKPVPPALRTNARHRPRGRGHNVTFGTHNRLRPVVDETPGVAFLSAGRMPMHDHHLRNKVSSFLWVGESMRPAKHAQAQSAGGIGSRWMRYEARFRRGWEQGSGGKNESRKREQ